MHIYIYTHVYLYGVTSQYPLVTRQQAAEPKQFYCKVRGSATGCYMVGGWVVISHFEKVLGNSRMYVCIYIYIMYYYVLLSGCPVDWC